MVRLERGNLPAFSDVVDAFPNVTLVDALDEIQEVRKRIADLSVALTTLGGFVLGCGALILIGSIAVTRSQRVYEAAILKTIGARKSILVRTTLIEYGVLGLVAGCIGSAASIVLRLLIHKEDGRTG